MGNVRGLWNGNWTEQVVNALAFFCFMTAGIGVGMGAFIRLVFNSLWVHNYRQNIYKTRNVHFSSFRS